MVARRELASAFIRDVVDAELRHVLDRERPAVDVADCLFGVILDLGRQDLVEESLLAHAELVQ